MGMKTETESPQPDKGRRLIFLDMAVKGVHFLFALSLGIFVLYMAGSMPDPGFSDRLLFFLLRVLRYSSLACCTFSLFTLGLSVHKLVYHPGIRTALGVLFYFAIGLLSAGLSMLDTFMIAATEGNIIP